MDNDFKKYHQWDLLIMTAGNKAQKKCFKEQILSNYFRYFNDFFVIEDNLVESKIGIFYYN